MGAGRLGIQLAIWTAVFTALTTGVVCLRMWAVRITRMGLQLSDYLMLVAYTSTLTMTTGVWWMIANGMGKHTAELSKSELGVQYQGFVLSSVTWLVATVCCKGSILAIYLRIFQSYRPMRLMVIVGGCILAAYFVAFLPIFLTQCHPVSYGWKPVPGGYCLNTTPQEASSIGINIFLDSAIAILPAPALWRLHIPLRNKITVVAMFGMGLIVVGVMIWRMVITLNPNTPKDLVRSLYYIGLVSLLELWLSIIIASLPALAPLFRRYIEPHLPSRQSGDNHLQMAHYTIGSEPSDRRAGSKPDDFDMELEDVCVDYSTDMETGTPIGRHDDQSKLVTK